MEELLEQTLRSVCRQTDRDFRVVVVCNQKPDITFNDPHVFYHEVDFPPPSQSSRAETGMNALAIDKGSKLLAAMIYARDFSPNFYFIFDADDLVSRRVAAFMNERKGATGWYVESGYSLNLATRRLQRKHGMVRYCGTTLAPNAELLTRLCALAESLNANSSQRDLLRLSKQGVIEHILGNHVYMRSFMQANGYILEPFPFRASTWVLETGENHSGTLLARGVSPSRDFCAEFGFEFAQVDHVPTGMSSRLLEAVDCMRSKIGSSLASQPALPVRVAQ